MTSHIHQTLLLRTSLRPNTLFDDKVLAAILASDVLTLSALTAKGLSPDYRDADGSSLLHLSVDFDQPVVTKWATEFGCNPCGLDSDGRTPLMNAISRDRIECARILAEHGGGKCPADSVKGWDAIHWVAFCGSPEVCRVLCQFANIHATTAKDGNAVTIAASHGQAAILEILVECGVSVNVASDDSFPIHWSAVNDSAEMIDIIVTNGGELESKTGLGRTPFFIAVMLGKKIAAKRLKLLGARTDVVDEEGLPPLWWAQFRNDEELIRLCCS